MTISNHLHTKRDREICLVLILMLGNSILFVGKEDFGKTDGTMKEGQREIIRNNYETLLKDLDPKPLMQFLFQENIITRNEMEQIKSIKTREDKCEELLSILDRGGPSAFLALVQGLMEKKKTWLARLLLKEGNGS